MISEIDIQDMAEQSAPFVLNGIDCSCGRKWRITNNTLTASEPEQQEPVAHMNRNGVVRAVPYPWGDKEVLTPLYPHLPASKPWVGLTNKDIYECEPKTDWYDSVEFARAIEVKLREKNA